MSGIVTYDVFAWGDKAFAFMFVFSIVVTLISVAMYASGAPSDWFASSTLMIPSSWMYSIINQIRPTVPSSLNLASLPFFIVSGFLTIGAILLQFMSTFMFGFLALANDITRILPPQAVFLSAVIWVVASLMQALVWISLVKKILDWLQGISYYW